MTKKIELTKEQVNEINKFRASAENVFKNNLYSDEDRMGCDGILRGMRFMEKLLNLSTRKEEK